MSGFLRRLAAQAMGRSGPVHSTARLPYAPLPGLVADGWEPAAAATPPVPSASDPVAPRLAVPARSAPPGDGVGESPPTISRAASDDGRSAQAGAEAMRPAPSLSVEPSRRIARERLPDHPGDPSPQGRAHTLGAQVRRMREEASARVIHEPAPTAWQEPSAEDPALPPPRAPTLLPPAGRITPRGMAAQAPAPSFDAAAHGPLDEPTEVHVSIGRIEITAVHESPAPKRRAVPASKPMTLDEYLARRRGERS